jgi:hypothetical protein
MAALVGGGATVYFATIILTGALRADQLARLLGKGAAKG